MKNILCLIAILFLTASASAQTTPPPPVPAPDIELSANGGNGNLYQGWPFILHVTILNTAGDTPGGTGQLVISPNNAPWTSAVSFTILTSTGAAVQWPLQLVGAPTDPVLTLGPTDYVQASWQISAANVAALPPGDYTITANIQASQSNGWNGSAQSDPLAISVGPEPALTSDQQAEKVFQTAEFALNSNDLSTAITLTQQLRIAQPDNALAGAVAANILKEAGYPTLAFLEASNALATFYRVNPNPIEAPSNFLPFYQELLTTAATPDSSAAAPTSTSESSASLTYSPNGQSLQLAATVSTSAGSVDGGSVTFTITGIAGSAVSGPVTAGSASATFSVPGGTPAGNYAMQASYGGTPAFAASTDSTATLAIAKATPIIQWNNPPDITVGAALTSTQLNATANVPGTFTYTPAAGTVLPVGTGQKLSATFAPTDSTDYNSATADVFININSLKPVAGDLNGDRVVNCADIAIVKNSFGKRTGQPGFDARADVNHDGVVNIIDLSTVARLLPAGTVCP
ncbi:MAG TPA: dockerin type I domain-containing protein [Candidatus Acidoferrum sp.]|nr:dockerin type I domain-containing protein [Candidatus Acidoferrum sp.]